MKFVETSIDQYVAKVILCRGKENAINETLVEELTGCFEELAADTGVKAVVLSGKGNFFSFGFDVPELLQYAKDEFSRFVTKFANLYTHVFLFPKPVIAALNGHTIAGGCMLATACDYRIMVPGKARISLNEINFGSSLFPGSVEMLHYCMGRRNAELVAYTGAMYSAKDAKGMGLVDQVVSEKDLTESAGVVAQEFAQRYGPAFGSIKMLLRNEVGEEMKRKDLRYLDEMVDLWYSEETWKQLQRIKIHE